MAGFKLNLFGKSFIDLRSGPSIDNPEYNINDPALLDALFGDSRSPIEVNQDTALTYSAVWRAVNLLSSTVAGLPKAVHSRSANGDRTKQNNHPVSVLLNKPSYNMNRYTWFERAMYYLLLWGDVIAPIKRNSVYAPVALPMVHPKDVQVIEKNGQLYYKIPGYARLLKSDEVIHIVGFGDGVRGKDPISVARESLKGGLIFQNTGNKFFENGYLNDRFISMPGKIPDKNRQSWLDSLKQAYMGMQNAGTPMLLEGGTELKSVGMPPENMQFLQSRKHHASEVARWFGIPPHKLYDLERSTNNNIEHQGIEFVIDSILSFTIRFETELHDKLFTEEEKHNHAIKFNINGLLRGDMKTRAEYFSKATGGRPWMTPDEVRTLEDKNKINGEASKLIDPANIVGNINKTPGNEN